jgi:hypothetical protein
MADTEDYEEGGAAGLHHTTHENGGSDEVTVEGLSGTLADPQTPAAHKTSHQDGGTDALSVTGLSGLLATAQTPAAHKTSHQNGGADALSVAGLSGVLASEQYSTWAAVSGKPSTFDPAAHKTSHQDGGTDEISVKDLSGLLADDQHVLDTEVVTAAQTIKLDDFAAPDDNTDLDVSTSKHGLMKKLPGGTANFYRADGNFAAPAGGDIGEGHICILPWNFSAIIQGTWALVITASQALGFYIGNTAGQNDELNYKVYLAAGTYTLDLFGVLNSNNGIATITIDGVSQGTIDLYGTLTYNTKGSLANIVVSTAGLKTLGIKIATHNASSSSPYYYFLFTQIALYRTA